MRPPSGRRLPGALIVAATCTWCICLDRAAEGRTVVNLLAGLHTAAGTLGLGRQARAPVVPRLLADPTAGAPVITQVMTRRVLHTRIALQLDADPETAVANAALAPAGRRAHHPCGRQAPSASATAGRR
jgi:hypothetical protein